MPFGCKRVSSSQSGPYRYDVPNSAEARAFSWAAYLPTVRRFKASGDILCAESKTKLERFIHQGLLSARDADESSVQEQARL
jgi:hypothetical protein